MRTLLLREGVIAGSLNRQTVGNASRYTLTDKVGGKTRCLYVPVSMEREVRRLCSVGYTLDFPKPTSYNTNASVQDGISAEEIGYRQHRA